MQKSSLAGLIIGGLIIFIIGGGLGVILKTQQDAPKLNDYQKTQTIIKSLTSKTVSVITFFGKITKISGNDIVLTNAGDSVIINISDKTNIISFVPATSKTKNNFAGVTQQQIKFTQLKIGDTLNVNVMVVDSVLSAQSITIFSGLSNN